MILKHMERIYVMKRKGLAILLVLCLALSLMTFVASAESSDVSESISVNDSGEIIRVVKGGRLTVRSLSSDEDGDYIWAEETNDGIVQELDNQEGKSLILKAVKVGTATYKLIVGNKEALFYIQVVSDKPGVSIIPDSLVLAVDDSRTLEAYYTSGTTEEINPNFTWGSEDPEIAEVDRLTGEVTGISKGETIITAQCVVNDRNWSKSCSVIVEDPYNIKYAESENGKVTGPKDSARDGTVTVTATPNENYKVTSITVASDEDGSVVANKKTSGTGAQSLNFEMPDSDVTVTAQYAVIDPDKKPLKGITLSKEEEEVPVDAQFALEVTYDPEDTTDDTKVVWATSNKTVATVEDGIVTGVKEGKATITATVGDFSKTCVITVKPALTIVEASKQELALGVGKSEQLSVSYKTSENEDLIAKWESSDPTVATVDQTGKVTARNVGTTEIKVTVGGESDTVKVTVSRQLYKINVVKTAGGTVTVSEDTAAAGQMITITLKPNDGYMMDDLLVQDADKKNVEVTPVKDEEDQWEFEMPDSNVTVDVSFTNGEKTFIDVPDNAWYKTFVDYVVSKGYLDGVGNNKFNPTGNVTRGQLVQILYAMEGKPEVTANNPFKDVTSSKYYYDAVRWASSNNIVAGYDATTFKPDLAVSRQQLAAVMYKYTGIKKWDTTATADITKFADYSKVSAYAVNPMKWAVKHGVIKGTEKNELNPLGAATRAEFSAILKSFDENVKP